ncbi:MAG: 3-oxoacyl-[acyl-carrier-protein] reductase [Anaerolineae bacterium]|jgi:3-oxoacyl-[acyl-carrier protein] reductase|nr:3-oxoacyl-[acyl-carrier-protein] reductase [Anaerolineae bacterium]
MTQDFKGQIAIVTGASRGIGKAVALALGRQGATVIVNYHQNSAAAAEVIAAVQAAGGNGQALQADVSDADQVDALFKAVVKDYGQVDILVNNAGITRDNVIMLLKPEDFDSVLETNLRSAWLCSRTASRAMMKKRYGRIINMTSVVGIAGNGGQTSYAASKAGMIGLTKALAKEVASRNITVNAVAPGFIETDMTAGLSDDTLQKAIAAIPLGRQGKPEEVAQAVLFLASSAAAYITGQVLVVDGGMVM